MVDGLKTKVTKDSTFVLLCLSEVNRIGVFIPGLFAPLICDVRKIAHKVSLKDCLWKKKYVLYGIKSVKGYNEIQEDNLILEHSKPLGSRFCIFITLTAQEDPKTQEKVSFLSTWDANNLFIHRSGLSIKWKESCFLDM